MNETLDSGLHVTLYDYPLSSCPNYTALSYTWGDPSPVVDPTYSIFTQEPRCFPIGCYSIDGGEYLLRVTRNLRDALRRLRQEHRRPSPLKAAGQVNKDSMSSILDSDGSSDPFSLYWIDSLCIDQDNVFERSTQVSFMGTIYKKAQLCLVWLGEENQDTNSAAGVVLELANDTDIFHAFEEMVTLSSQDKSLQFRRMFHKIIYGLPEERIVALASLLSRTWFSRVWVLQEVALAPIVLVQWGSQFFEFRLLMRIGLYMASSRAFLDFGPDSLAIKQKFGPGVGRGGPWAETPQILAKLSSVRAQINEGIKPRFSNVIDLAAESESTDPRDMIYGLLAITAEFQLDLGRTLPPDYTLPVHIVYLKATSQIAIAQQSLDFLRLVCSPSEKVTKGLPSWCPDYTIVEPTSSYKGGYLPPLSSFPPDIEINDKLLAVRGFRYDTVDQTTIDPKGLLSLALKMKNTATRIESLWRLVLQDKLYGITPAPKVAGLYFPAIIGILQLGAEHYSVSELKGVTNQEMNDWARIVDELSLLEPKSRPFLPNLELMQTSFVQRNSATMGEPGSLDPMVLYSGLEIASIHWRAAEAGLTAELEQLLGSTISYTSELDPDRAKLIVRDIMTEGFIPNIHRRCFFTTQKAEGFGLANKALRIGDQVWAIHGAPTLAILRPLENGNYEYLSAAYVDGTISDSVSSGFSTQEIQRISIE
ncbi:hypothetical protein O1611_g1638 [Lasiodiplodia mahajangana]|uniref:Uncharacterized protein n=1 Tax=Lasiodiplodia mahajangana TaxID=1108764 RepID=A0ACC2JX38_9PEZI|nr:hypothetical protein O1611_g1638 [Lasiodiplodia mahajangana]